MRQPMSVWCTRCLDPQMDLGFGLDRCLRSGRPGSDLCSLPLSGRELETRANASHRALMPYYFESRLGKTFLGKSEWVQVLFSNQFHRSSFVTKDLGRGRQGR